MENLTLKELITLDYVLRARIERVSEGDEEAILWAIIEKIGDEFSKR